MLGVLFRKQIAELLALLFRTRRAGKKKAFSIGGVIAILVLLFVTGGVMFFYLAKGVSVVLSGASGYLYYFIIGIVAVAIGLVGSVFGAYSTIFRAKDNDLLLSLPIPPKYIVFTRIVSLSVICAFYELIVLLPTFIVRVMAGGVTPLLVINHILLLVFVTAFVVALSLALAFVVAAIARRVKHKSLVTVVVSLVLLALYYYIYFILQSKLMELSAMTSAPQAFKTWLFVFYYMALASEGSAVGMLIFGAVAAGLFALAYFLLVKFFITFTIRQSSAAIKARKQKIVYASPRLALYKREWKKYLANPSYILNCTLGSVFMIFAGVLAYIKADAIASFVSLLPTLFSGMNGTVLGACLICMISAMNYLTAPSISLEGRTLWLLRSLPVSPCAIFAAKVELHLTLTLLPALFLSSAVVFALKLAAADAVLLFLVVMAYVFFSALLGLTLNILKPFFNWTNEMYAVKSGVSVILATLGSFALNIGLALLYMLLSKYIADVYYLIAESVLFAGADVYLVMWLRGRGAKRFDALC